MHIRKVSLRNHNEHGLLEILNCDLTRNYFEDSINSTYSITLFKHLIFLRNFYFVLKIESTSLFTLDEYLYKLGASKYMTDSSILIICESECVYFFH